MNLRPRNLADLGVRLGVVLLFAGAALLFYAWAKTAGLGNVALQIPYVISAGCTGLGLVAVGLTLLNVSTKLADERVRQRHAAELRAQMAELRDAVAARRRK